MKLLRSISACFIFLITFSFPLQNVLAQEYGVNFTDEEKEWLSTNRVLKVANELDWPPFDFAENDEPRGYSIDLFKLAANKLQLKYEFVNGYSWAEIMDLFRKGNIDILPAIYSTEERLEFINFTKPYASNPSILVVNKKFTSISNLDDLNGKTVAVISGYATAKVLEDRHPEIERIYVKDAMDGLQQVSVGNVNAFIGSLGIITYLTEQNFIPNIKIVGDVGLKKKIETELHMGVSKDNIILRNILQKGLDAISHKDMRGIRQAWFPIEVVDFEDAVSFEYMTLDIILPILLVIILLLLWIFKRLKPQKKYTNLKFGIAAKILVLLLTVAVFAVGIIGLISFSSGQGVLEEELFDKLTAVREMKSDQIEDHFDLINNQILTFSKDRMIIEAMNSFKDGLDKIDRELNLNKDEIEKINTENREYFSNEFKPRITNRGSAEAESIISEDEYWEGDIETQLLQNLYISDNKNETGSKDLLVNAGDGSSYSKAHQIYHPIIRDYLKKFKYYDIFLVDNKTGHIVYSVFKEADFGTNLLNGPYSQTNIAKSFISASKNSIGDYSKIVDFEPYLPSYNEPAAFISSPIIDNKKIIGVLIFQMPIDAINDIMTNKNEWLDVGLGLTGETYLVGDDYLMRSQSRFLIEDSENYFEMLKSINIPKETINQIQSHNSSIGLQPVKTVGVEAALRGETGTKIFYDYRGVSVLSSYKPTTIKNVNWVIMSEMDEDEAFEGVYSLRNSILLWFGGIIIFIVIIGFVFAKSMTLPIIKLTESAKKLAEGNLDVEIDEAGTDEIGMLAGNFNTMRSSLKELINSLEESNLNLEKKVEERTSEIQTQQRLLENTLESLTHPFYVIDASDYTLKLANSAARKISESEISTCYALTHKRGTPCDSKDDPCPLDIVKKTKQSVVVEHKHYDNDNNLKYAEVHGYPIFDDDGNVTEMIEYSLDITERKKIEDQLRYRSAALEAAANGIVITNSEGIIRWVNPAFSLLTGYEWEEVIGQNPSALNSGKHDAVFFKNMWETIKSGKVWHGEVVNKKKDGTLYTEEMTITPVLDDTKKISNFVAIKQDVTERKELERQLEDANKRMQGELDIGKEIQMSMLPLTFPAFPDRSEFAVYADLIPALEVGGDFYDFFFIDEDRFCFVIGDVSGKGVPAALFMAMTKTLIKSRASSDFSTASILTHVNDEMSRDNNANMFITVFMAIISIKTGELVYTNAGHNPTFIKRIDNSLERLDTLHGPIVAAVEDLTYKEDKTTILPGESLLLYTDGVTEALDIDNNLFSDERLIKYFSKCKCESVESMVNGVVKEVKKFEGEADQADDITVLAFKYLGQFEEEDSMIFDITIKNGLPAIEQVTERFNAFADEHEIDISIRRKMSIVFDEFLNNIISYAYDDNNEHDIDINVNLINSQLAVTIIDDGIPFDPFASKTPDTDLPVEEREIGGLGIHLVRNMMDKVSYTRKDDKNIVTLIKSLNS